MKAVRIFLIFISVIALVVIVGGYLLPSEFQVSEDKMIKASPQKIYAAGSDFRSWQSWNYWSLNDPTMQNDFTGAAGTPGHTWNFTSPKMGSGKVTMISLLPPRQIIYTVSMGKENPLQGSILIDGDINGSRVTMSLKGSAGSNPIRRWLGFLMSGKLKQQIAASLEKLDEQLTEEK